MKILVMVNGHSLAHVSRPLEICKELKRRGHDIVFSGGGKYLSIVSEFDFKFIETPYIDPLKMQASLKKNKLNEVYALNELQHFLESDLELIKTERPDLILNDCRITARTAAEISKVPIVAIANSHMTNQRSIPFVNFQDFFSFLPDSVVEKMNYIENQIEFIFYHRYMLSDLVKLRKKYNLMKLSCYDLEGGDLYLIPDIPEFNPIRNHPLYHFTGPLTWKNMIPAPKSLQSVNPEIPLVYLSIGSYSLDSILNKPELLKSDEIQFIIAAGKDIVAEGPLNVHNVFIEKFINVEKVLPQCELVVCHGGNGTIYQALGHGLPVLGFSGHAEQAYGLKRLDSLGLGKHISSAELDRIGINHLIKSSLDVIKQQKDNLANRQDWQKRISRWNGQVIGANIIEKYFHKGALLI